MEDISSSPVSKMVMHIASFVPLYPLGKIFAKLKEYVNADSAHKVRVMIETVMTEVRKHDNAIQKIEVTLSNQQAEQRANTARDLLIDATRKSLNTRSIERVKRIGLILANGVLEPSLDADETEEMMRIAMDLTDKEIAYLSDLVNIEGQAIASQGRLNRYSAHTAWERGPWGATKTNPEIDSVFSKLGSYGLVAPIPPPNNLNIMADFQNRYVLLPKGARFVQLLVRRPFNQAPVSAPR